MSFRSRLRPFKHAIGRIVQQVWSLGFAVAGRLSVPRATRWISSGGERVLIVAPHPDDEAAGCAGTILQHAHAGDHLCLAIATDGRQSKAAPDPTEMARLRKIEAGRAARLMQIDRLDWIGLPEGEWVESALQGRLIALIQDFKPDIVYAPSRIDFHPEHLRVAHGLALALNAIGDQQVENIRVRIYQIQVPLSFELVNLISDVSARDAQCDALLSAYASQSRNLQWCNRQKSYSGLRYGTAGRTEVFWEICAREYVELHGGAAERWPPAFRGMRNFSLTDPLAYLVGMRERRRISAASRSRVQARPNERR